MNRQKVIFKYILDIETVIRDKSLFDLKQLSIQGINDAIALSDILILDGENFVNSIIIKDTLFGFCCNLNYGLNQIRSDNKYLGIMVNLDDLYSFKYFYSKGFIVLIYQDVEYRYKFDEFCYSFKRFYKKVVSDLSYYYPALDSNVTFKSININ